MLTLIVARARDGAIGRNNDIPWSLPNDLAMFQRETIGGALIMGRRTWESLPVKPLKGRMNCVISRDRNIAETVCGDVHEAISACTAAGYHRLYGIGGSAIYEALLPLADRMLISEVDISIPDADTWFPSFNEDEWQVRHSVCVDTQEPSYTLREIIRREVLRTRFCKWGWLCPHCVFRGMSPVRS